MDADDLLMISTKLSRSVEVIDVSCSSRVFSDPPEISLSGRFGPSLGSVKEC